MTGRPAIQDEFTNLTLSRQMRCYLRHKRDRKCVDCGNRPLPNRVRCEECSRESGVVNIGIGSGNWKRKRECRR